jgi:hypothetical protein
LGILRHGAIYNTPAHGGPIDGGPIRAPNLCIHPPGGAEKKTGKDTRSFRQLPPWRETLSILNSANSLYLCYLSKPAADRAVYRAIHRGALRKLVELGVGTGGRALRMIDTAAARSPLADVQYTGLDLFEARSTADGPGMSLKTAYRTLYATRARIRLVPGDPWDELVRTANSLGKIDLLLISAGLEMPDARAWWFVLRLLHEQTRICIEERSPDGTAIMRWKTPAEIQQLASAGANRRAA